MLIRTVTQSVNGAQEGFYDAAKKIDRLQKILIKYSKMTDNVEAVRERLEGITSYVLTPYSDLISNSN